MLHFINHYTWKLHITITIIYHYFRLTLHCSQLLQRYWLYSPLKYLDLWNWQYLIDHFIIMTINLHVDMKVEEFCMARYWHYDRRGTYPSLKLLDRWCCQCNLCVYSCLAGFCMQDHIFTLMRTQDWVEELKQALKCVFHCPSTSPPFQCWNRLVSLQGIRKLDAKDIALGSGVI